MNQLIELLILFVFVKSGQSQLFSLIKLHDDKRKINNRIIIGYSCYAI